MVTWEAGAGRCCCLTCLMGTWAWFREEGRPLRWAGQAVRVGGRCLVAGGGGGPSQRAAPLHQSRPPPAQAGPAAPLMVRRATGESEQEVFGDSC